MLHKAIHERIMIICTENNKDNNNNGNDNNDDNNINNDNNNNNNVNERIFYSIGNSLRFSEWSL